MHSKKTYESWRTDRLRGRQTSRNQNPFSILLKSLKKNNNTKNIFKQIKKKNELPNQRNVRNKLISSKTLQLSEKAKLYYLRKLV